MFGRCLESVLEVFEGFWEVFGMCLRGSWDASKFLGGV